MRVLVRLAAHAVHAFLAPLMLAINPFHLRGGAGTVATLCTLTTRTRFVLVLLPGVGGRERHALPPERSHAPETLCGLACPGHWTPAGFTVRLSEIECVPCRHRAEALLTYTENT